MIVMKTLLVTVVVSLVRLLVTIYTYVTLPLYYLFQQPWRRLEASRRCGAQIVARGKINESDEVPKHIRQLNYIEFERFAEIPHHPMMDNDTVADAFAHTARLYELDRPSIGYRQILAEEVQFDASGNPVRIDGKLLRKYRLSDYKWLTLKEIHERVGQLFRGVHGALGIKPGTRIAGFSETSVDYFISFLCQSYCGTVGVALIHTMNDQSIVTALNETETVGIFTSFELLDRVAALSHRCPHLKVIIYAQGPHKASPVNVADGVQVFTISEVMEMGRQPQWRHLERVPITPDQQCAIIYTSGTSGRPKGVIITHGQLKEAAMCIGQNVRTVVNDGPKHVYVAYLPQAHVLEMSIELFLFIGGVRIGFATPFTLNESAPGLASGCRCDLQLLKPTVMTSVPLVLDRMQKEIDAKLKARTPFSKNLFDYLIGYKQYWISQGYRTPITNLLVCPKVQIQFGGRLQYLVVGGAPLAEKLQSLIKCAVNVTLIQGYGATETSGGVFATDFDDITIGTVGSPLNNVHARLIDWNDGNYSVHDKPNPRGEIMVGGKMIARGYFGLKNETEQAFFDETNQQTGEVRHFFITGDIGELFPDGTLKIIDRKKDLVKLSNGEYISLGKVESILKSSSYVDNICVVCNNSLDCLIALVVPNKRSLLEHAHNRMNLSSSSLFQDICNNAQIVTTVHQSIIQVGFVQGLKPIELPSSIRLCPDEWSPDNDLLTAAMKLKRANIHRRHHDDLEQMAIHLAAHPEQIRVKRVVQN